jgi:hypothetical protein
VAGEWTARATALWDRQFQRGGTSGCDTSFDQSGQEYVAFAKGRQNQTVVCVGVGEGWDSHQDFEFSAPPDQDLSLNLEVLTTESRGEFATGFASTSRAFPTSPRCNIPAAIAWVAEDEMLIIRDDRQFFSVARGGQAVPVPSSGAPDIGLAIGRHGILHSATTTQVLQFVPVDTIVLTLATPPPRVDTVRLAAIAQPGKSIRIESSPNYQSWSPVQTLVSTGTDEVQVNLTSRQTFFRGLLLP